MIENAVLEMKLDFETNKDREYIANYIYNARPTDGYTKEDLLSAYFVAEGLNIKQENFELEKFLLEYTQYVGKEYLQDYMQTDETVAEKFAELFKANRKSGEFSEIYKKNMFAAKCICTKSSVELKNLIPKMKSSIPCTMPRVLK